MKIFTIEILSELELYLKDNRFPLLLSLVSSVIHILSTKPTFKNAILKIMCAFLGALIIAPAITEYFNLGLKMNNLVVLGTSFATFYIIKGLINELKKMEQSPFSFFLNILSKIKNTKDGNIN